MLRLIVMIIGGIMEIVIVIYNEDDEEHLCGCEGGCVGAKDACGWCGVCEEGNVRGH